jgi:hypothetical protein
VLGVLHFRTDRVDRLAAWGETTRRFSGAQDVAFVAIQEGGTAEEGRLALERHGVRGVHGRLAEARVTRQPGVTAEWALLVDRAGVVRFDGTVRDAERGAREVEALRAWAGAAPPLVGRLFGPDAMRWWTPEGRPPLFADAPLTLLRWWTNDCHFCTDSIPALVDLRRKYAERGLRLAAVYHPKGRRLSDDAARAYALRLGHDGPVAFDDRWAKLIDLQRRGSLTSATSISVLVDRHGTVLWTHPGPRIHPSASSRHGTAAADHAALDRLLDRLLPPLTRQETSARTEAGQ